MSYKRYSVYCSILIELENENGISQIDDQNSVLGRTDYETCYSPQNTEPSSFPATSIQVRIFAVLQVLVNLISIGNM